MTELLTANGAIVSETQHCQQSQNILALAEMSKDFRDNQASNYGYYTDTDVGNAGNNLGYVVRRNFSRMACQISIFLYPKCLV